MSPKKTATSRRTAPRAAEGAQTDAPHRALYEVTYSDKSVRLLRAACFLARDDKGNATGPVADEEAALERARELGRPLNSTDEDAEPRRAVLVSYPADPE